MNEKVLQSLLSVVRPKILREFRADSCIVSTAIGIDILTRFGILAEPLAVRVMIFNERFMAHVEKIGRLPRGGEIKQWTDQDGAYSVGIGSGVQQPGKWAGHLVLIAEKKYLVDLSIDQASRPNYGMVFEPICCEIDQSSPYIFNYANCLFRYETMPENLGYQKSPDWMFASRRKNIVENSISEMELI